MITAASRRFLALALAFASSALPQPVQALATTPFCPIGTECQQPMLQFKPPSLLVRPRVFVPGHRCPDGSIPAGNPPGCEKPLIEARCPADSIGLKPFCMCRPRTHGAPGKCVPDV
ncbi:MAG TPA: hypothetical protein VFB16_09500 [Bauldia sp.]|nr:hypothetical protein [Bauldia sp.]